MSTELTVEPGGEFKRALKTRLNQLARDFESWGYAHRDVLSKDELTVVIVAAITARDLSESIVIGHFKSVDDAMICLVFISDIFGQLRARHD